MRLAESALRAGYRLNSYDTLGSTNDEAMARAAGGDRGRLWIVAASQSAGRGRQGRAWSSPPGNLYASLLLVDAVAPAKAWQLGFVGGVALVDAIRAVLGEAQDVAIKWPNDCLAGTAKVAGLLCEASRLHNGLFATVIGFGVNRVAHPQGTSYPATDLFALGPARPSLEALFAALSDRFPDVLALWDRGRGFPAIRTAWLERALPSGTPISVSAKEARLSGRFETIDAEGRLMLATPDGVIGIDVGDVIVSEVPAPAG